jgi:hypothetical protein
MVPSDDAHTGPGETVVTVGPWLWTVEIDGLPICVIRCHSPFEAVVIGQGAAEITGRNSQTVHARPATLAERRVFARVAFWVPEIVAGIAVASLRGAKSRVLSREP